MDRVRKLFAENSRYGEPPQENIDSLAYRKNEAARDEVYCGMLKTGSGWSWFFIRIQLDRTGEIVEKVDVTVEPTKNTRPAIHKLFMDAHNLFCAEARPIE